MKKKKKPTVFTHIKECWHQIAISDKALIIIMAILLMQCVINLFTPEPTSQNNISIAVIVRTTIAAIFGYFLSENFLKQEVVKNSSSNPDIIVHLNDEEKELLNSETTSSNSPIPKVSNDELSKQNEVYDNYIKEFICNKSFQVIVAFTVCVIALLSLIIGNTFDLIPKETSPTIVQFRDLISSCVGFLLGHSSHIGKSSTK